MPAWIDLLTTACAPLAARFHLVESTQWPRAAARADRRGDAMGTPSPLRRCPVSPNAANRPCSLAA